MAEDPAVVGSSRGLALAGGVAAVAVGSSVAGMETVASSLREAQVATAVGATEAAKAAARAAAGAVTGMAGPWVAAGHSLSEPVAAEVGILAVVAGCSLPAVLAEAEGAARGAAQVD